MSSARPSMHRRHTSNVPVASSSSLAGPVSSGQAAVPVGIDALMAAYEPLEVIGNGSFGLIRKVIRKRDGVVLARKEIDFEKMSDRDRKQIVAEVNILRELDHENIVKYHERFIDKSAGKLYILMEYCGGGDLGKIIKNCRRSATPLSEDTVWNYLAQLGMALHHCHRREASVPEGTLPTARHARHSSVTGVPSAAEKAQILHRDLKPENVFLDSNGELKLGDFGLSKNIGSVGFANTYVGTPYYMSPELVNEKAYDHKSDIWSLGCLIYELCALNPPFYDAKTQGELSAKIRSGQIPNLPRGYSKQLDDCVKAMLRLDPNRRPSTTQLLEQPRVQLVRSAMDLTKKWNMYNSKLNTLQLREATLSSREAGIAIKEQELANRQEKLEKSSQELALKWADFNKESALASTKEAVKRPSAARTTTLPVMPIAEINFLHSGQNQFNQKQSMEQLELNLKRTGFFDDTPTRAGIHFGMNKSPSPLLNKAKSAGNLRTDYKENAPPIPDTPRYANNDPNLPSPFLRKPERNKKHLSMLALNNAAKGRASVRTSLYGVQDVSMESNY